MLKGLKLNMRENSRETEGMKLARNYKLHFKKQLMMIGEDLGDITINDQYCDL